MCGAVVLGFNPKGNVKRKEKKEINKHYCHDRSYVSAELSLMVIIEINQFQYA